MKNKAVQKKQLRHGFGRLSVFVLLALAGMMAALFLMKQHITTPATPISQAEFLDKFASKQIVSATIVVNQQALPLVEITGNYLPTDKDGKMTKDPMAFVVHNAWLTPEQLTPLSHSFNVSNRVPVMNLIWGIAPFLVLCAPFFILGVIALILFRTTKGNPPGAC